MPTETVKENYELVTEKTPVSDQQQKVKSSLVSLTIRFPITDEITDQKKFRQTDYNRCK